MEVEEEVEVKEDYCRGEVRLGGGEVRQGKVM